MSQAAHVQSQLLPRGILIGAGALISFAISAVVVGRASGIGDIHMPAVEAYQVLHLDFADADDGAVLVRDAGDGSLIYRVAPGTNGFMRAALRGFAHERQRDGIGRAAPFTLSRLRDGTLSLADETTGRRINLDVFGPTQVEAFAQLFAAKEAVK